MSNPFHEKELPPEPALPELEQENTDDCIGIRSVGLLVPARWVNIVQLGLLPGGAEHVKQPEREEYQFQ